MGVDGFEAFGKPVSNERRTAALKQIRSMGIIDAQATWECIGQMAHAIERDQPYEAMEAARKHVDLTGTYVLMAVLCTAPEEANR